MRRPFCTSQGDSPRGTGLLARPIRPASAAVALAAAIAGLLVPRLAAPAAEPPPAQKPLVREIFVPFADLNVLLENQPRRVLLGRDEYEALLAKAKKAPEEHAPRAFAVVSVHTTAAVAEDRARLTSTLLVEVLEDGLWAVPLDLGGVGLREATLDGKPAPVGRAADGRLSVFVEGKGRHALVLEMVAPLATTAAQQSLSLRLPGAPAARMELTVPGDVEIKTGADVASRVVDEAARVTRFEIVPRTGDVTLVMTLNSRLARQDRVVMAQSVVAYEVTQAYERLHAAVSFEVLHRAVDSFRLAVPEGFDVTGVSSPLLSRWNIVQEGPRRVLEVTLREQTTERVRVNVAAVRAPARLDAWTAPRLEPLDVAGHTAWVGLLVEDRLQVMSLQPAGLAPVDVPQQSEDLLKALPESVGAMVRPAPGTPLLRPAALYYAPQAEYGLAARFERLPARFAVTTNVLLVLGDQRHEVTGGFALLPEVEKLYGLEFSVPAGWHVDSVLGPDNKLLPFEHYAAAEGPGRVRIRLAQGIPPGQTFPVRFHAVSTPQGWLGAWTAWKVAMPVFAVAGAARDAGAVAVACTDDIAVRLESQDRLVPLAEAEKERFSLKDVPTNLAYRYEAQPYSAAFEATRTSPRLTARTFSFLRVTPDALVAHYELIFSVEEAHARTLTLLLPSDAPAALSIRDLDGGQIKEESSKADGATRWTVQLAQPRIGEVRLAVDFQKPISAEKAGTLTLPIVRAEGRGPGALERVVYQTGFLAVEGSAELDVQVKTDARRVHVGELADAEYQPGRRLLGAYSFAGDPPAAAVAVSRQPGHPLYPAIVQKAELVTLLSTSGVSQTAATFELRTKALFLEVALPAGSKLWSAELNGQPIKPQREGERVLVGLPDASRGGLCRLKIVYETPVNPLALTGRVRLAAPELALRAAAGATPEKVPMADLEWKVGLPHGYEMIDSHGTVAPTELEQPLPAAVMVAGGLAAAFYYGGGGTPGPGYLAIVRAREAAHLTGTAKTDTAAPAAGELPSPYYAQDDVGYFEGADKTPPRRPEIQMESKDAEKKPEGERKAEEKPADKPAEKPESRPEEKMPEPKAEPAPVPGVQPPATPAPTTPAETSPPTVLKPHWETKEAPTGKGGRYARDLAGMRALQIELGLKAEEPSAVVAFQSLGEAPMLSVTLASRPRLTTLGVALALAVLVAGVARTNRTAGAKARFILGVAAVATLVPVLPGCAVTAVPANMAFFAAALLVPYYLAAGLVRWLAHRAARTAKALGLKGCCAAGAVLLVAACLAQSPAAAQAPAPGAVPLVQIVEPLPPVTVPDDAIIVPYDPDSETGIRDARKIMVPYAKYVELWNRAYPDKKLDKKAPPAPFGLAGASYAARLAGDEYLLVEGRIAIDVFTEEFATVPLALDGGVLALAELDGKPAQISVPLPEPAPANPPPPPPPPPAPPATGPQQQAPPPPAAPQPQAARPPGDQTPGKLVVLQVAGKGRHELKLAVRLRLERRGGWRIAAGALPAAPASSLAITVPEAGTEVRLDEIADRASYDTIRADEKIETALGAGGRVRVEWRPKVTEGQIDRGLTVQSAARLDVQEDGLGVAWQLNLDFPRSQRDRFTVAVPGQYLVQKVEGGNVRGWSVRADEQGQTVEITLLKAAKDKESVSLRLWRKGPVGAGDLAQFDAPIVRVPEAAMQGGVLAVRRSPLLDVETLSASGVSRTDAAPERPDPRNGHRDESALGIRPYQAYRFVSVPFTLRLSARPAVARVRAEVQTVLKIAEIEQTLESAVRLDVQDRPVYRVEMFLPVGLLRESVAVPGRPGTFEWSVAEVEKRRLLTVYLKEGRLGRVELLVEGRLPGKREGQETPVPRLEVRGAASQQSDLAVQADPAVKVALRDPKGLESVLLGAFDPWLRPAQREAVRMALRAPQPDYSGTLVLSVQEPEVVCTTISNVRVTSRAVEETVLLDFNVSKAGVRELVFLLPALPQGEEWRISVPELRQKTVKPAEGGPPGMVRVRLELQDEKTGLVRVLVQNDRLLVRDKDYEAPIPVVETGRVERQFVTMQSWGRDEVLPGKPQGLEPIGVEQREWKALEAYRLGRITQAYAASAGAAQPRLAFRTRQRPEVQTAEAGIGLAVTDLVMDGSGAYRAEVVYTVFNSTEQFLQIALPEGAALWTARVDGQPVKPAEVPAGTVPAGDPRLHVRVPLVKTAAGELDYPVEVQYGGKMDPPGNFRRTRFPLAATVNIRTERSAVRLHLPGQFQWYDFRGTMGLAPDEGSVQAQKVGQLNKMIERLVQTSRGSDEFSKAQAVNNLKQLGLAMQTYDLSNRDYAANPELQEELAKNSTVMREAQQQIAQVESAAPQSGELDNRYQLNALYAEQKSGRARNVVQDLGGNWDVQALNQAPATSKTGSGTRFNDAWFDSNGLLNPNALVMGDGEKPRPGDKAPDSRIRPGMDGQDASGDRAGGGEQGGGGKGRLQFGVTTARQPDANAQPQAAAIADEKLKSQLRQNAGDLSLSGKALEGQKRDAVTRYKDKLNQQQSLNDMDESRPGESTLKELDMIVRPEQGQGQRAGQPGAQLARGPGEPGGGMRLHGLEAGIDVQDQRSVPQGVVLLTDGAASMGVPDRTPLAGAATPKGLASLYVTLPKRGDTYVFTTPGGDCEIIARTASGDSIRGVVQVAVVVVVVLVTLAAFRAGRGRTFRPPSARALSTALIALGALGFLAGIFPIYGLLAAVVGIGMKVYARLNRPLPEAA